MSKIALIGGGGLAKEIIEVILMNGDELYGIFAKESNLPYPYLGYLNELLEHKLKFNGVILAIGAVNQEGMKNRENIISFLKENNINLISVISPLSIISQSALIGKGVYIGHGCIISCDVQIEDNVLINHNAIIGHDVEMNENVSIAPQVFIGGEVEIEKNVMIGAAATIRQGIKIRENSIIGMRSIVIKNLKSNSYVLHNISKVCTNTLI